MVVESEVACLASGPEQLVSKTTATIAVVEEAAAARARPR